MKSLSPQLFDYAFRILLVLLPFMTVLSIFTKERLGIPGFSFLKEALLAFMLFFLAYYHVFGKQKILWSKYDFAIGAYIVIMVGISVFTTGIAGILYGGKYDFSFLLAFFILYHGYRFLEKPPSYYLKLFLISGGVMLFISMLLKWPLSEDLLLYLGYSGNPSNWQFGSAVPIFHGVEGANIRRFQGLLDGPNAMGAFLLMYIGFLVYSFRYKKDWYFVIGGVVLLGLILILYTSSRSAALGFIGGVGIIILFSLTYIYRYYRIQLISLVLLGSLLITGIFIQYAGNMKAILNRAGSTSGHIERMTIGMERFLEHPLGQGLGSAGPAYRHVENLEGKKKVEIDELDRYYIPESWYIQQLVEGGIFGFLAFMSIILLIFRGLFRTNMILFGMFFSICIMNFFLHTFESSVVSLSLFLLIGLILAYNEKTHENK